MSTTTTPPTETEAPFDATKFFAERNAREAARAAGKPEPVKPEVVAEPAKPEEKSAKPSGDQRKLFRTLRENGRIEAENAALKARLDALEAKDKPKEAEAVTDEPKRENFSTDQEFADARAEWKGAQGAEKTLKAKEVEAAQLEEIKRISGQFEAQMKAAADPEKGGFDDWGELLKSSKAASIDIFAAAPEIYMAFMGSEYAKDVMHEWLLKPETLTGLLDMYKTDVMSAIKAFHRFEGRVGREAEAEKPKEEKKGAAEEKPKPRPTRTAQAPSGEAPAAEPAPGSAAWMAKRNGQKASRGW